MNIINNCSLISHFSIIKDPRVDRTKRHKLIDILTIAICAIISNADNFEEIELFGKQRLDWLKTFLVLPIGIPSHDTFGRVFSRLETTEFQTTFTNWTHALHASFDGQVVAIDGKAVRGSFDAATGCAAIHLVFAWASETGLTLGQVKVDGKSNEITAIPILQKMLQLKGAIVTIDAMGCQKAIAKQILKKEADYVLNVKGNQPSLFEDIELAFNAAKSQFQIIVSTNQTNDKGHGRIETRYYQTITDLSMISAASAWQGARCVGSVISTREIGDKIETETRYFISSLSGDAQDLGRAVREH